MPTFGRPPRQRRYQLPADIHPNFTQGKYYYERLSGANPVIFTTASSLTALPTAVQGQTDVIHTSGGSGFIEYFQTTAQTLQPTAHATKGLIIDGDQLNNETQELVPGGNTTTSPFAMVTGTDSDFFFRVTLEITVSNGSDQLLVGWRKQQAYQVPTSFLTTGNALYTDFAAIGFASVVTTPNAVVTATDIGGSGSTTVTGVNFTWASTTIHQLEVRVVGRKAVYLINGVRVGNPIAKDALGAAITSQSTTSAASYTFTSGLTLVPFIFVRQDAALTTAVYLRQYEVGHLVDIGLDPSVE